MILKPACFMKSLVVVFYFTFQIDSAALPGIALLRFYIVRPLYRKAFEVLVNNLLHSVKAHIFIF